jgi:transcriptional regulator GlxA family with amidase domain
VAEIVDADLFDTGWGIHFRRLVSFYRIRHAKKLLVSAPAMNIAAIALESGFSAINTFQRTFKQSTGLSPLDYRRKYRVL